MILPSDRYAFSTHKPRRKRGGIGRVILIIIIVAALLAAAYVVLHKKLLVATSKPHHEPSLSALWQANSYAQINRQAKQILTSRPLDEKALIYNGFAYFYEAVAQSSLEKRLPLLNHAIVNLRRALLRPSGSLKASIYYVLGKSYYFKGKFYLDLAIKYLNKSVEDGYSGRDTFEYVGLAYSDLGEYNHAATYFKKALAQHSSGLLLFILAQTYYKAGNNKSAEEYLLRAVKNATGKNEASVEEQARFLLGKIYTGRKAYGKAENQYKQILDADPKSANAHYYLGDVYSLMNQGVKARAEWRQALRIDPSHWGARMKLYK